MNGGTGSNGKMKWLKDGFLRDQNTWPMVLVGVILPAALITVSCVDSDPTAPEGSTITVTADPQTISVANAGDEGKSRQLGSAISTAVQAELIKQQRPGGLLAR